MQVSADAGELEDKMATGLRIVQDTLAGAPVSVDTSGSSQSLIIYNFDLTNSYTVTFASGFGDQTVTLPAGYKIGIPGGTDSLTLNGTGAYKVMCYNTVAPPVTDLQLIGPDPNMLAQNHRFSVEAFQSRTAVAGADTDMTAWVNLDTKPYLVVGVALHARAVCASLGGGETAEIQLVNSGAGLAITPVVFDDNPGGGVGVEWPSETMPYTFTLGALVDRTVAPGDNLVMSLIQSATAQVGDFAIQIDLQPVF